MRIQSLDSQNTRRLLSHERHVLGRLVVDINLDRIFGDIVIGPRCHDGRFDKGKSQMNAESVLSFVFAAGHVQLIYAETGGPTGLRRDIALGQTDPPQSAVVTLFFGALAN